MHVRTRAVGPVNVGPGERILSVLGGGGLVAGSVARRSLLSVPLALAGGYLVFRGVTGHCRIYDALDIRRSGRGGIKVRESITIFQPLDQVFAYWRELENLPRFMHHLESVQRTGDGHSHWRARAIAGQSVEWEAETYELRENELIAWRSLPGSQIPNSGSVTFREAPGGRGSEIHVSLEYTPPGGSAGAALAKLLGREPGQQVREDLRRLKAILEAGEVPTTEGQPRGPVRPRLVVRRARAGRREPAPLGSRPDLVQEASEQSFPGSDAPGWTGG